LFEIVIPASVKLLGKDCLSKCRSLCEVRFESGSKLSRIGNGAFRATALIQIVIPASGEVLGEDCFAECRSLSSVTFEETVNIKVPLQSVQ
jgi:hypothetical protein